MLLLDKTVAIYRLEEVSGNRQSYTTVTTTLQAAIQPISDIKSGMAGDQYGKLYVCYLDVDQDIQPGDKVIDRNGIHYKIMSGGIENRDDGFMAQHMKVTMQRVN